MNNLACSLQVLIEDRELDAIWQDSCALLWEVGLELEHPALLAEFAQHAGVRIKQNRVCFSPALAERARSEVEADDQNYAVARAAQKQFEIRPPYSPFDVIDLETGEKRAANERDVSDGARLYDSFGVAGPAHVHLREMDQRLAQLTIAKLCCENSRSIGNWAPAYCYEEALAIRDLYLAAGRSGPLVALQMVHSPLRLDRNLMDILSRARSSENGLTGFTAGGGAMPLAGVSAPIFYRAAAAQGVAECLGGWLAARLIDPALKPYASFAAWPPDLSTGKWAAATPEALLFDVFNREIMKRLFGLIIYAPLGPLAQMCLCAAQGCRIFEPREGHVQNAFSPAHVPLDIERLGYVASFCAGLPFEEEARLATRLISEVLPETCFLGHESTLSYRNLYWHPALFTGLAPERAAAMLDANSNELLPQARAIAKKRIREHQFALSADVQREVERTFKRGLRALEKGGKEAV